jgi:hypothetical protein
MLKIIIGKMRGENVNRIKIDFTIFFIKILT